MNGIGIGLIVFSVILCSFAQCMPGHACTTFIMGEGENQLFGRNYDFGFGDGYVMVNKKGVRKESYVVKSDDENGQPATWVSSFGSITFNQFGRDLPQGGMNEAGLVIETMSLSSARYPQPDSRPYLRGALLWRQFVLDTCASVREIIESDARFRISYDASKGIGAHFLVLDKEGNAATIEFLDGKMVVHTGASLPVRVLSNDTYEESLAYWKRKSTPFFDKGNSIQRFVTAANLVSGQGTNKLESNLENAFGVMAAVKDSSTRWSIVYDNRNMKIYFRTDGNTRTRAIDATQFDYSCKAPVKVLDINGDLEGDVTGHFVEYTPEINTNLTKTSCAKLASRVKLPPEIVELLARYPEHAKCEE